MPPADGGSPNAAAARRTGRCRAVRPPSVPRIVFTGFAAVFGLPAAACLPLAVIGLASGHLVGAAVVVGVGVVLGGLSGLCVAYTRREGPALTMTVCPGAITMSRHRRVIDTIPQREVGLIVLHASGRAGVTSIAVYRPDRSVLGRWDTNWGPGGGGIRAVRALRRLSYPWAFHDRAPVVWRDKFRSKLAPSWTDEVVRP